jgi:hypothetical protein
MLAPRIAIPVTVAALATGLSLLPAASPAADVEQNTTGLPTYPHMRRGLMDSVPRNTLGRQCTHYAAESGDPLEMVEAWYRKALPGAVESNVNDNSI